MNFETQEDQKTTRPDFDKISTQIDEINMNIGEMSEDDQEKAIAERKALRAQQAEIKGNALDEATAMDEERSNMIAEKKAQQAKQDEIIGSAQVEAGAMNQEISNIDARLNEINMNIGGMSEEDQEKAIAERKALRAQKAEILGGTPEKGTAEGQEKDKAEKMAEEAEKIKQAELDYQKKVEEVAKSDAEKLAAVRAEIAGVNTENPVGKVEEKVFSELQKKRLVDLESTSRHFAFALKSIFNAFVVDYNNSRRLPETKGREKSKQILDELSERDFDYNCLPAPEGLAQIAKELDMSTDELRNFLYKQMKTQLVNSGDLNSETFDVLISKEKPDIKKEKLSVILDQLNQKENKVHESNL